MRQDRAPTREAAKACDRHPAMATEDSYNKKSAFREKDESFGQPDEQSQMSKLDTAALLQSGLYLNTVSLKLLPLIREQRQHPQRLNDGPFR